MTFKIRWANQKTVRKMKKYTLARTNEKDIDRI